MNANDLPTKEDVFRVREGAKGADPSELVPNSTEEVHPFYFYTDCMLKCVAGAKKWKSQREVKSLSQICTASDEAFVLTVLDNYWGHWASLHKRNEEENDSQRPETEALQAAGAAD